MRCAAVLFVIIFLLSGCGQSDSGINRGMTIREQILQSQGCEFEADITADYTNVIYEFTLKCSTDRNGSLVFEVLKPESIAGITGLISQEGGKLTFDNKALAFDILADGQLSPVCAPWLMVHTLRSGYLRACGEAGEGYKLEIDDSYAEDALHLDIWTDENDLPMCCEILWQGRRYLSIEVRNFRYL